MTSIQIEQGLDQQRSDVTQLSFEKLVFEDLLCIPAEDPVRACLFGDPVPGQAKKVQVTWTEGPDIFSYEFESSAKLWIHLKNARLSHGKSVHFVVKHLWSIHKSLRLSQGSLRDELPEQEMAIQFVRGHEKVLEIGGNIGRNSCVIASLLKRQRTSLKDSFVVLECNPKSAEQLCYNRDQNDFDFVVVNAALSEKPLIQQGWTTRVSDACIDEHEKVNCISWTQFKEQYPIDFDTLILDCEGAFYNMMQDMPQMMNSISTIIMENDQDTREKQNFVECFLQNRHFVRVYQRPGPWGPCAPNFYEVWTR